MNYAQVALSHCPQTQRSSPCWWLQLCGRDPCLFVKYGVLSGYLESAALWFCQRQPYQWSLSSQTPSNQRQKQSHHPWEQRSSSSVHRPVHVQIVTVNEIWLNTVEMDEINIKTKIHEIGHDWQWPAERISLSFPHFHGKSTIGWALKSHWFFTSLFANKMPGRPPPIWFCKSLRWSIGGATVLRQ